MKGLRKIDNIMYRVKDLDASVKFYSEVLGLKQVWKDESNKMVGFVFPESDSEIVIHTNENISNPDFSFLVDNVGDFVKEFRRTGYKVYKEPFDIRSGKFAIVSDPDDNIINIIDLTKFNGKPRYDHGS